jgi:hypothetical protein
MPVKARAGGQGRVRTGRIGGQTGSGSTPGSPTGDAGGLVFTTDFTALSALPAGVSLSRATTGTRFNSSGVRVTEAIDAARFDYAWSGSAWVAKGLLTEGQRTNLSKDSGDLTTANWGIVRASRSTSSTLGANNSTFMTMITASAGTNTSKEIQSAAAITVTSGANYAAAFDVKKTNWNYVRVGIESDTNQSWISVIADLSTTGAITETAVGSGSGTLVSSKVTALANGIFRVEFVGSIAATTAYPTCGFASAATGNSFSTNFGDVGVTTVGTETLLVDAGQFALGAFTTSYITTTSAAVTRSADVPSSSSPLTGYLAAGPSVWEFQDEATGTIARSAYAAGTFDWPVNRWYRSMGVYSAGTDTSSHMTNGSPY